MKRTPIVIAIAAAAVIVSACTPSVTVESPGTTNGSAGISVSGTGEVSGTPDTLTMTFGVTVRRDSVSEASPSQPKRQNLSSPRSQATG